MEPIDLRKQYKDLYAPSTRAFSLVQVPPLQFLMVDGRGNPNTSPAYREAIEALYAVAYGLKFGLKKAGVADWPVMPLEGLWWAADLGAFAEGSDRHRDRHAPLAYQMTGATPTSARQKASHEGIDRTA